MSSESNLELAETARSVSLGWANGSPMLRTPNVAALPPPSVEDDDD